MRHDKCGWYRDLTPEQQAAEREAALRRHRRRRGLPAAVDQSGIVAEALRRIREDWRRRGLL